MTSGGYRDNVKTGVLNEVNFERLRPSRKKLAPGDIFAMRPPDGRYLFGRVILADLPRNRAPMPRSYLIYVYSVRSDLKGLNPDQLTVDRLLLPPMFINRLPWSRGYFETVAHRPLKREDLVQQYCFRRWTGKYVDETGKELSSRLEPCGDWALDSYRTIDDQVSDALGIPRTPE